MVDGYSFQDIFKKLQQVIEELLAEKKGITLETPILLPVEFISPFDARISSGLSHISTDPNVNPLEDIWKVGMRDIKILLNLTPLPLFAAREGGFQSLSPRGGEVWRGVLQ